MIKRLIYNDKIIGALMIVSSLGIYHKIITNKIEEINFKTYQTMELTIENLEFELSMRLIKLENKIDQELVKIKLEQK
jgi:hypothetical protein